MNHNYRLTLFNRYSQMFWWPLSTCTTCLRPMTWKQLQKFGCETNRFQRCRSYTPGCIHHQGGFPKDYMAFHRLPRRNLQILVGLGIQLVKSTCLPLIFGSEWIGLTPKCICQQQATQPFNPSANTLLCWSVAQLVGWLLGWIWCALAGFGLV